MTRGLSIRVLRACAEEACWILGAALILMCGVIRAEAEIGRRADVARIEHAREPDRREWSESRIRAWRTSAVQAAGPLLGTVRIPAVDLEVPLYADTSELHLNRGVGHIAGTDHPGGPGNLGVAGHRDGYFRALKRVKLDDLIEVRTPVSRHRYRITQLSVVEPSDARLLRPTPEPAVTLVTCYPFYFVGSAPQRFVVRGVLEPNQGDDS